MILSKLLGMKRLGFFLLYVFLSYFNTLGSKICEKPKALRYVPLAELIGNETTIEKCPRCCGAISCFLPNHFYCLQCSNGIKNNLEETFRKRFVANLKREQDLTIFGIKGYEYYQKEFFKSIEKNCDFFIREAVAVFKMPSYYSLF